MGSRRDALDYVEYRICERRGHEYDGYGITYGYWPTWGYCKWCHFRIRTEPERIVVHPDDADRVAD